MPPDPRGKFILKKPKPKRKLKTSTVNTATVTPFQETLGLTNVRLREIRRRDPEPPVYFPTTGEIKDKVLLTTYGVEVYKEGGEFLFIPWSSVIEILGSWLE